MNDVKKRLQEFYNKIPKEVTLVAVSKTFSPDIICEAYEAGQRDFGENYVQEWMSKKEKLPGDIRWHFIGHLQTNKVKYLIPGVYMIHSVDSQKLLNEIRKNVEKKQTEVKVLLQIHISGEETKFGMNEEECENLIKDNLNADDRFIKICGLMGMASLTDDREKIRKEFRKLKLFFDKIQSLVMPKWKYFNILSMGMSSDYIIAIEEGSNMLRIGSAIFGERDYNK